MMIPVSAQPKDERVLSGEEITKLIVNRRIYLQVPLGGEFPLHYMPNGVVDGTGTAAGLGHLARVSDEGRWWVTKETLCQQWKKYENGRRFCFRLTNKGDGRLAWDRDDGLKGLARIGD